MTKIFQLVNACRECPNCAYYSGGTYVCTRMQRADRIPDAKSIPSWCPLTDHAPEKEKKE